jgi:hypothetical protein
MPTINDATVVNSAYDTSGNGGRKLVMLDNGWLVAVTKTADYFYFYVNKQDGNGFVPLCHIYNANINNNDIAIGSKENKVYAIFGYATASIHHVVIDVEIQTNTNITSWTSFAIDQAQSELGNISLAINEEGTELHATWASKNSTYPSSFNIRYAKGTINEDGSVTWGAVEQVSTWNATNDTVSNPSIVLINGNPMIFFNGNNMIGLFTKAFTTKTGAFSAYTNSSWGHIDVKPSDGYAQSSPSAIFVPQEINGLPNGRIWVAWYGKDATHASYNSIRTSYSDDGGITWSSMQKLTDNTSLSSNDPSITANNNNEIFILFTTNSPEYGIRQLKYNGSSWTNNLIKSGTTWQNYPSTLFDFSINFTNPLFIYKDNQNAKVGFYGTWTTTEISEPEGELGPKISRTGLLTYNITTDGSMSTITEKINGTVVGTKTLTSGQNTTVNVSQTVWDSVSFGKYKDATGARNMLTIEMGEESWIYTFEKGLAADADILSAVKAVKDANEIKLPFIKQKLVDKVGGSIADSFESLISDITILNHASGTTTTDNYTQLIVSGLTFKPKLIVAYNKATVSNFVVYDERSNPNLYWYKSGSSIFSGDASSVGFYVNETGFKMYTANSFKEYAWVAY